MYYTGQLVCFFGKYPCNQKKKTDKSLFALTIKNKKQHFRCFLLFYVMYISCLFYLA